MTKFKLSPSYQEIDAIINFLGYGNPFAPVWFIGFEEGLGDMNSEDAIENCKSRGTFSSVMDLHAAHLLLRQGGQPIDLEKRPPRTQVWRFIAKIMLARQGHESWHTTEAAKDYVRFCLGRKDRDTFLTELSPIPASRTTDLDWMTRFAELDDNLAVKIQRRKNTLKQLLKENTPSLIICYGRKRGDEFASLLDLEWERVSNQISKSRDSKCLLLPFFGNGQMSRSVIDDLIANKLLNW
jgi:hypothetical protein